MQKEPWRPAKNIFLTLVREKHIPLMQAIAGIRILRRFDSLHNVHNPLAVSDTLSAKTLKKEGGFTRESRIKRAFAQALLMSIQAVEPRHFQIWLDSARQNDVDVLNIDDPNLRRICAVARSLFSS